MINQNVCLPFALICFDCFLLFSMFFILIICINSSDKLCNHSLNISCIMIMITIMSILRWISCYFLLIACLLFVQQTTLLMHANETANSVASITHTHRIIIIRVSIEIFSAIITCMAASLTDRPETLDINNYYIL